MLCDSKNGFKNIVELKKDIYLLHEDNNNLVVASYKNEWNFKETGMRAQSITKLKAGKVFILSWGKISLSEYNNNTNKLVILKSKDFSLKRGEKNLQKFAKLYLLCYPLNFILLILKHYVFRQ